MYGSVHFVKIKIMNWLKRLLRRNKESRGARRLHSCSNDYSSISNDPFDPANIMSPLNPLSPFSIWDDNESSNHDYTPGVDTVSDHSGYSIGSHHSSYSSHDDTTSYGSSDSSSYDSGSSCDSSSSSFD